MLFGICDGGVLRNRLGEDPWLVGQMGIAQVKGYIDGGISPMLKPFGPGGAPLGGLNLASVESGERIYVISISSRMRWLFEYGSEGGDDLL